MHWMDGIVHLYGTPFAHINIQHICNFFSGSMNELLSGLICILSNFFHLLLKVSLSLFLDCKYNYNMPRKRVEIDLNEVERLIKLGNFALSNLIVSKYIYS